MKELKLKEKKEKELKKKEKKNSYFFPSSVLDAVLIGVPGEAKLGRRRHVTGQC